MTLNPTVPGVLAMDPSVVPTVFPDAVLRDLRSHVDLRAVALTSFDDQQAAPLLSDVQILITGWGSPVLDSAALHRMPALRAVVHAAGSVRQLLNDAVFERGITVSSAAAVNARPVAEYTIAVAILAAKQAFSRARGYRQPERRILHEARADTGLYGATVGVVGASHTGRLVSAKLVEHGARVLLADPYATQESAHALGASLVDLDTLCRRSDIVTIHAPALPQTLHMFDARRLAMLRDGAVLINTARGSLVDTEALANACATGRIDAVLDVTDPEPLPIDHRLLSLPNVLVTPHLSGSQGREQRRLGEHAVAEVRRFLAGQPLAGAIQLADLAIRA